MKNFDHVIPIRIIFGKNTLCLEEKASLILETGTKKEMTDIYQMAYEG